MTNKFVIILGLAAFIFFANIWGTSIYILDEAKNAGCAREMFERSDLVVPTFNGKLRTDKPPLHYYFMIMAYYIQGEASPFSARFFSSLMGVLTVITVFLFSRKALSENAAFYAGLVLLASLQVAVQFHLAVPDPYLIFFTVLGSFLFYQYHESKKPYQLYLGYACFGLAFLAKGPVALVLPALGILLALYFGKSLTWRNIISWKPFQGALVILLIIFPWYYAIFQATDGVWVEEFFFKHNIGRYTSTMEGHGGFPLAAPVIAIAALLPFSVFIFQAVALAWRSREHNFFLTLSLGMSIAVLSFFSFSRTILPSYISPALPFMAVLLGYYLSLATDRKIPAHKRLLPGIYILLVIAIAMPVAAYFGIDQDGSISQLAPLAFYLIVVPIGVIIALILVLRSKFKMMYYTLAGTFMLTFLLFIYIIYPRMDESNPVYKSHKLLKGHPVYYLERMNASFVFYHDQEIPKIESLDMLNELIENREDLMIISRRDKAEPLFQDIRLELVFEQKDLFENHTTLIFGIRN
ncbi:glycosyltransferase family 39 protein [Fulvivirga ulvae]|uniref:ArnT family glycosyltransferase n=1 Tax=Fulvivirga ulvae TaxID=2904245 RepID=UPI001F192192|nr:glycosyltransferase family 39 protein [Fulvivirga ulvae]UII35043.1 glycosyltransferase family 39 protein [Fulvivirga ulvae]